MQREDEVGDEKWTQPLDVGPRGRGLLEELRREADEVAKMLPAPKGMSGRFKLRVNESIQSEPRVVLPNVPVESFPRTKQPSTERRKKPAEKKTPDAVLPLRRPPTSIDIFTPSSDPIMYDRTLLPTKYASLLRVLDGLETANVFTRSRKQNRMRLSDIIPTISNLANVVFSEKTLATLVGIIPEAFHITPVRNKHNQDDLEIELIDPQLVSHEERRQTGRKAATTKLTPRRILLHKRLLKLLKQSYEQFLSHLPQEEKNRHRCDIPWHEDFDIEAAPDPPTADLQRVSPLLPSDNKRDRKERLCPASMKHLNTEVQDSTADVAAGVKSMGVDSFVPDGLLERVRRRERIAIDRKASGAGEKDARRLLLSRLPTTMDAVRSILGTRSKMELSRLVDKLAEVHRERWSNSELQLQLRTLHEEVPEWAEIEELKSKSWGKPEKSTSVFKVKKDVDFAKLRKKISRVRKELIAS